MNKYKTKKMIKALLRTIQKSATESKRAFFSIAIATFLLSVSSVVRAELIETVYLSPLDNSYTTSITDDPLRHAWTYPSDDELGDGHDIWTIDTRAFDENYYIDFVLSIQDSGWHPDNHRIYWNSIVLGETGFGTRGEWSFQALAGVHSIELEWLNPIPGGAWYQIDIVATQGALIQRVPEPNLLALFSLGVFGLLCTRRRN